MQHMVRREAKKPSPIETLKENSRCLRGALRQSLDLNTTHFEKGEDEILKHHGAYQQDDRDLRQGLLKEGKEPAYSIMVRSKIPGGRMSAGQYLMHDELAAKFGNDTLRITVRQSMQFHGVLRKDLKTVIRTINQKLGTTLGACGDVTRNFMTCPAPLEDRERTEIFKFAKALSDEFLPRSGAYHEIWLDGLKIPHLAPPAPPENPEPIYGKTYLPRKLKMAVAFPEDNCVDVYTHDIGIVPELENGGLAGFDILVGGGFGMTFGIAATYPRLATPFCFVRPEKLVRLCRSIVELHRDFGNRSDRKRARLKYLIDEKGMDWFREETEKRFGEKMRPVRNIRWKGTDLHLGWHEGKGGKWFCGIPVESGRIKDDGGGRLKTGLREAVKEFQPEVRLTAQQNILLCGLGKNQKGEIDQILTSYGIPLASDISPIRKDSAACPALPTCPLAITEAERVLPSVIGELEQKAADLGLKDQRLIVRMTGCPNGCARPYNAEIAFVGRAAGAYNIYVGGNLIGDRLNFLIAEKVPLNALATMIRPLLWAYKKERLGNEGFGDFCYRNGAEKIKAILSAEKTL